MPDKKNPLFANTEPKKPVGDQMDAGALQPVVKDEDLLSSRVRRREVRADDEVSFEEAYQRVTLYLDKQLRRDFDQLVRDRRESKTRLFNEAVADLLRKYDAM